jgi:hypothetical protein
MKLGFLMQIGIVLCPPRTPAEAKEFAAVAPIEEEEELPPEERLKIVIVSSEVPCCSRQAV